MKNSTLALLFISMISFAQQDLFGVVKIGNANHVVEFDITNGTYVSHMQFPTTYNDFLTLTYDCRNNVFYTIGNSFFNEPSKLLRINPANWTYVDLGFINVYGNNGNLLASSACQVEGLAYNSLDQKLYAALNFNCSNYYSNRFVVFDFNQPGNFAYSTLVGETQTTVSEHDMMAFANENSTTTYLYGVDAKPQTNQAVLQYADLSSNNPGYLIEAHTYSNSDMFRGLTYNTSDGLLYSFSNQQNTLWLTSFAPHYLSNSGDSQNIVSFSGLTFNQVRGLSYVCSAGSMASIENNDLEESDDTSIVSQIFPNPSADFVRFETELDVEAFDRIVIYDASGKAVHYATKEEVFNKQLDLGFLNSGMYFIYFVLKTGRNDVFQLAKL